MRFLVAGLILIAVAIGVSEWTRRNPSEKKDAKGAPKVKNAPVAPPTMQGLTATVAPAADEPGTLEPLVTEIAALATTSGEVVTGFAPLMRGQVQVRELRSAGDAVVMVIEKGGSTALVRWPSSGAPSVLSVRSKPVSTLWFDASTARVVWGEGGMVKSVPVGGGDVKTLIAFERALVTSVAAHGDRAVASLVPRDGDPFSAEPNGAVVAIEDQEARLIALEQIRPREVLFDGKDEAFFVAGYPSGLTRAALDGSFTARIADRADGPVALEPDGITYRFPQASGPELRRGARAGGAVKTLARVDVEWLAVQHGVARYTTTGIAPRLYEAKAEDDTLELAAIKGAVKGLAWAGGKTWLLTMDDAGLTTLQVQ
jgi:hypothetical protein